MADPLQIDIRRPRGVRRPLRFRVRNLTPDQYSTVTIVVPSLAVTLAGTLTDGWWVFTPTDAIALAAVGRYPYELVIDRGLVSEVPGAVGTWTVLGRVA